VIALLKREWEEVYLGWKKSDLSARRYVDVWETESICRRAWSRDPSACWC